MKKERIELTISLDKSEVDAINSVKERLPDVTCGDYAIIGDILLNKVKKRIKWKEKK